MTNVTQTSPAQLGPGGHWRNWVGNQSFIARHIAEPGSEDELAQLVREASSRRPFHPRRRLRPFVHADRRDQRLAPEPEQPARARQRRSRPQARRRARWRQNRRYRPRAQRHRAVARQSGRYRHPGDRRRPVDRHAWHRTRPWLPVVPSGRHAAHSAGRVGPRGRRRPRSGNDGGCPGFDRNARRDFDDHPAGGPCVQPQGTPVARRFRLLHGEARRTGGEQSPFQFLLVSGRRVPPSLLPARRRRRFQRSSASTTSAK